MATEVLLMTVVDGLGKDGDIVSVADGYARNYLLPREATRRRLVKLQAERQKGEADALAGAQALAKKVAAASCTITVKVGDGEQLYGSVTESDIADALKSQDIEIDRNQIVLSDPIKELGTYDVSVHIHPEVEATVKVWVVEE